MIDFIDLMRGRGCRVEPICRVLTEYGIKIAARTYRAAKRRPPSTRSIADGELIRVMRHVRETPDQQGHLPRERFYGRRKMTRLLNRIGIDVCECTVGRLMALTGMQGLVKGIKKQTTRRVREPETDDLLNRCFTADRPNSTWVTDMTYVLTLAGWAYVAFMIDVFSRLIMAWEVSTSLATQLATDTLNLALWARDMEGHRVTADNHLIHHSDHGCQYTSIRYGEQLMLAGITPSFGSIGDALDNALAESVNSQYKAECVDQDGPFESADDVRMATADWAHWYNHHRLHASLDYRPPAEAETEYYQTHKPATTSSRH